jgi:hypothetical protein
VALAVYHDWFPRNDAMNHLLVSRARPVPHATPVPIPLVTRVVIRLGALGKIEQRTRVPIEDCLDVAQSGQIAHPANVPAKRPERFVGHGPEAHLAAVAQFPDRRIHVASEWIRRQRLLRRAPSPSRRMPA